jgi:hypothetical protein
MTHLERGISLVWAVDSYWRTISTTHMGLSAGLVRGDSQFYGVASIAYDKFYSDSESELLLQTQPRYETAHVTGGGSA